MISKLLGLSNRFLDEFEKALERIIEFPNGWHQLSSNTRRCRMRKFPYGIIYQIRNEVLVIIAVANLQREPLHWAKRTKSR